MRAHRFWVGPRIQLKKDFWLHDERLLWQWNKVLRFNPGQKIILFDGEKTDRLYELVSLAASEAHLRLLTELKRNLPPAHVYLFWSLLKRENNEFVLQKCTEVGVSNFIPIVSDRTIKKDFNAERAQKIIIEASEQCGRSDIPRVREPLHLKTALEEYSDKLHLIVCRQGDKRMADQEIKKHGILIGPEGGWSENEQKMFSDLNLDHLGLGQFTLRAETAAIVASAKVL